MTQAHKVKEQKINYNLEVIDDPKKCLCVLLFLEKIHGA